MWGLLCQLLRFTEEKETFPHACGGYSEMEVQAESIAYALPHVCGATRKEIKIMVLKTVDNIIINFSNVVTIRTRDADNRLMPFQIVADCVNNSTYLVYGTTEETLRDNVYRGLCKSMISQGPLIDIAAFASNLEKI